jgi:apolipoprotein N-acyltransferase
MIIRFFRHPRWLDTLALLAGAVLPFAFAPFRFTWIAFISATVLLATLLNASRKRAFWRGFLFGVGLFGIGASWVYVSIHYFGGTPAWLSALFTAGFVALLSVMIALQTYLFVRCFPRDHWIKFVIGFPAFWVLAECFRSWVLTGFPWLLLGNSQLGTWLSGYAPIVSGYGLSFLVAMVAGLIVNAFFSKKRFLFSAIGIILIFVVGNGLNNVHWTSTNTDPISVALVQGNIPQSVKWQPNLLTQALDTYKNLTEKNLDATIIVWPEAAVATTQNDAASYLTAMNATLKDHHNTLLTGIVYVDNSTQQYYNAMTVLGDGQGLYFKQHLVPFGEYVPLQNLLRGLINFFNLPMSNFAKGSAHQTLLVAGDIKIAPFLCYEIAYLPLILNTVPEAQLLLTVSDDSWFGKSWAAAQQLEIAQMRSLEVGRYQLVDGNDGITAIIDDQGNIVKRIPRFKTDVLREVVFGMQGSTPLVAIGWLLWFILLLVITGVAIFFSKKSYKK